MEKEVKGYRQDKETLIFYEDDNKQTVSAYVYLIEVSENLITFRTGSNVITIPSSKLIKLKQHFEK
jgi:hypothetical protein